MVIGGFLGKMFLPAAAGVLACLALRPFRLRWLAQKGGRSTWRHEIFLTLFVAFLLGLFSLIVLPSGQAPGRLHYNLIPFQIIRDVAGELKNGNTLGLLISFGGNIVMFLPLGFFPALLWRGGGLRRALAVGLCTSLAIELCQLPLGRSSDVDDLWLNTLGAGLGYGLYFMLNRWNPLWTNGCRAVFETIEEAPHGRETGD